jgi:hypothetical protein
VPGVLAPSQALGAGPVLDSSAILQPAATVVDSTPMQAAAHHLGGSACSSSSSSSAGPAAWTLTPQAPDVPAPPQPLGPEPLLNSSGVLQQPALVVNSTPMQVYAPNPGGSACSSSSSAGPAAWTLTPQAPDVLAAPQPLGPVPMQDTPRTLHPAAAVGNSTPVQADAPHLGGSACSSSSNAGPAAWTSTAQAPGVLGAPHLLGAGHMLDPSGVLQPPAVVVGSAPMQAYAPHLRGSVCTASSSSSSSTCPSALGVLQPPAVVVSSAPMQAYAADPGGLGHSSSSADPTTCAPTPQVSYAYEEPLVQESVCVQHAQLRCSTTHLLSLPVQGHGGVVLDKFLSFLASGSPPT